MKKIIFISLLHILLGRVYSQNLSLLPDSFVQTGNYKNVQNWFRAGIPVFESRLFFMSTNYTNVALKDDHSLAAGGGVGYITAPVKGFGIGANIFVISEVISSPLEKRDPITGQVNRYELGLYDQTDSANRAFLFRPEELFGYYMHHKLRIRYGRMFLNTPLINTQDGRMRGTMEQGIWLENKWNSGVWMNAGIIRAFMPRGTVHWYGGKNAAESIGIYPQGVDLSGKKSAYYGKINSKGMLVGSAGFVNKKWDLQLWNYFLENICNSVFLQAEFKFGNWTSGIQYLRQDRIRDGGSSQWSNTYFESRKSNSLSAKVQYKIKNHTLHLNATRIFGGGRYVFPREWGRDPFYTFMARERNEGSGDVSAVTVGYIYAVKKTSLRAGFTAGYYDMWWMPNPNPAWTSNLNKYSQPDYFQMNIFAKYGFKKALEGLELSALVLYKGHAGNNSLLLPKYEYNRVNMYQFNLVLNYNINK